MKWKKLGRIFCPDKNFQWMQSHASYPWAEFITDDVIEIYFSCRDINNKSFIGKIIFDLKQLKIKDILSN